MIFIFFGPPGAGKGTQAKFISNKLKIVHLSTGDILRNQLKKNNDLSINNKRCVIIGAGGVARAIAYGLIRKGIKSISIKNRTIKSKQKLLEWIDSLHPTNNLNENPNIIINCTPLGMWPKINSMPDIEINNQSTLIETVYNPLETKWLKYGKEIGAKTISGLDMFIWQGIASIELWMGEKISEKIELEKVKKVLKSELC